MSVLKYLDLSTGHIHQKTADILNRPLSERMDVGWPMLGITRYVYGWFILVPPISDIKEAKIKAALGRFPGDLADVLWYASEKGCNLVRLDSSGIYVDDLPRYQWL